MDFEEANSPIGAFPEVICECRKSDISFDLEKKVNLQRSFTKINLLSCQPRVTVTSYFVYNC